LGSNCERSAIFKIWETGCKLNAFIIATKIDFYCDPIFAILLNFNQ